jgi:hypothetical protein
MQRGANLHACCRGEKKTGSRLKFFWAPWVEQTCVGEGKGEQQQGRDVVLGRELGRAEGDGRLLLREGEEAGASSSWRRELAAMGEKELAPSREVQGCCTTGGGRRAWEEKAAGG